MAVYCPHAVPIEVSFENPSYTFSEESGHVRVCVMANTSDGIVNPVSLTLSISTNSSAQGRDPRLRGSGNYVYFVIFFGEEAFLIVPGSGGACRQPGSWENTLDIVQTLENHDTCLLVGQLYNYTNTRRKKTKQNKEHFCCLYKVILIFYDNSHL